MTFKPVGVDENGNFPTRVMSALKGTILGRSLRTSFYDTFSGKPDGFLVEGEKSDSGHPYALRVGGSGSGQGFQRVNGYLTHAQTNTASNQAAYGGINMGKRGSKAGVRFMVPAEWDLSFTGAPTGGTFLLLVDGQASGPLAYNASASAVAAALNALVGITGAVVTGTTVKTIRLSAIGDREAVLTTDSTNLTGGTSPAAVLTILAPETLTLINSKYPFTTPTSDGGPTAGGTGFPVSGAHCNFNPTYILYETLDYPFDGRDIQRKNHAAWTRGVWYVADIEILGNSAMFTLRGDWENAPEPIQIRTKRDPKIYNQSGNYFCFELYAGSGAKTELIISEIWAEARERTGMSSPSASRHEVAKAGNKTGRLLYLFETAGPSTATAVGTSMTTLITTPSDFEIPTDVDTIYIEGSVWVDRILPASQVATSLRLRACVANDTYAKEQTVLQGYTLANTTGAAITHGALETFGGEVNIAALYKGDQLSILIKAAAGVAGQFNFVNSGDALGGASSLRRSRIAVYATKEA